MSGPVVQIAAGGYQSLVLTRPVRFYAFGDNDYGELASAATTGPPRPTPAPPGQAAGGGGPAAHVAAGFDDSLVLTTAGQLYAFGNNEFGQMGPPLTAACPAPTPSPNLSASLPVHRGHRFQRAELLLDVRHRRRPCHCLGLGQPRPGAHDIRDQVRASGGALPYKWTAAGFLRAVDRGDQRENLGQTQD